MESRRLSSVPSTSPPMPRRRRSRLPKAPFIALALVLVALAALVAIALIPRAEYDPDSLCPTDGEYPRTAILIDATDSLSVSQVKTIREEINALRNRLALNEWVGIFLLDEDNLTLPTPMVALCNPGDESTANPLYENPTQIRRRFDQEFRTPIGEAVEQLVDLPPKPTSPILEMVRAVALDRDFDSTQKRRLIVVSDMLQNTQDYSHYRADADFNAWQDSNHAKEFLQLSMLGVEVEILYLKRPDVRSLQTLGHVAFWESYFGAVGAKVNSLKPLQ